ncbi:flagellar hook-associated protein FlgK [Sulfurimonas lithotrophica]|uniref:Flagellar hook-associated protein 1 n=1 Tax=Sulfurimonas lithotrophica TaxID=2590022 RepID=A0A5P8NYX2_9BACT|nr:flagellar hook-associated protein FlgK [Sulfurimonas lithotrophica]QFR48632.1 flagellar hook-associated protein FlgK [Sulfurimonas lithotrophica]
MPSIFNTLHIGYTGLNASQAGVNTTSHNISNAESEGYTRQRVVTAAATPIYSREGQVGNGADIQTIKRIFDNFVFDRYTDISADKEYADFSETTLTELSTYFPEIEGVGIKADLAEYYNMWQTLADNPDNDAIKLSVAQQTEILTKNIKETQARVISLQNQVNDQLVVNINEVNDLAEQLAEINGAIDVAEAGGKYVANDLRDKRNVIEESLSRLIGSTVNVGQLQSNIQIDSSSNTVSGSYTLSVNGFNIVDGSTFHKINVENDDNPNGFYELSYERQDGVLIPMDSEITGGRIGAILDLRGKSDIRSNNGVPTDGILQKTVSQLDAFAAELIEATNNIYAQRATDKMTSNEIVLNPNNSLVNSDIGIKTGAFNINIYDIDGNIVATREIDIDVATSMTGVAGSNSIQGQIEANVDDNADSSGINDIDDFLQFNWVTYKSGDNAMELFMDPAMVSKGYSFAIEDKLNETNDFSSGTNFAGALGMNRFFDGTDASDITLNFNLKSNPTNIFAGKTPAAGDANLALDIVQQQFEEYEFEVGRISYETTMYGMFDLTATDVGTETNAAILYNETITAKYNATELEYQSVSKVSIDEEMTNLIRYQTSYGAAAKIITTVDQMMQTLLGIKQ